MCFRALHEKQDRKENFFACNMSNTRHHSHTHTHTYLQCFPLGLSLVGKKAAVRLCLFPPTLLRTNKVIKTTIRFFKDLKEMCGEEGGGGGLLCDTLLSCF